MNAKSNTMNTAILDIEAQLAKKSPLVGEEEIQALQSLLEKAYHNPNDYFILQIGDCAERFEDSTKKSVFKKCQFYFDVAQQLENALSKKIILLGRIAGQYAKPRTDALEVRNGQALPIYKGDMLNGYNFSQESRVMKPSRILDAYNHATQALNSIQKFYVQNNTSQRMFTSHEALVLDYENGLTRVSENTQEFYNYSAHTVWLGQQSRELNGPQIEYLSKIENPIGIKLGPTQTPETICALLKKLNPKCIKGKIYLITRLGVQLVDSLLPKFIEAVQKSNVPVLWCVDPMHGNTFKLSDNRKIRSVKDIIQECARTHEIHQSFGTSLQGIHLEASCDDITECVSVGREEAHLCEFPQYQTQCDPRLNPEQVNEIIKHFNTQHFIHAKHQNNSTTQSHL